MSGTAHTTSSPREVIYRGRPIAIIDIGSNSVRLVVFDNLDRAPVPAFNEKSLCGLGNGVVSTGRLSASGIDKALAALRRFRVLTQVMGIEDVRVIATAAARDASNGPEFIAAARQALGGLDIALLSGPREAELSAYGVISGAYKADGIAGDLGGGSLEIIDIRDTTIGPGISLPLGGLALMDASNQSPKAAAKIVREAFSKCPALDALAGRTFYAVGGTWRSLAKLRMGQRDYPLVVMHGYTIPAREAAELADLVERVDASNFLVIETVNSARRPLLAYGAVVLNELIRRAKPKEVCISTFGVREGLLYEALTGREREEDALIVATRKLNQLLSRAPAFADELIDWLSPFLMSLGLAETAEERRLREGACYLSEVNWRAHPDYRGVQSSNLVSTAVLPGVDHPSRSFLSLVTTVRHVGLDQEMASEIRTMMPSHMVERGQIVGACLRVASVLAAGMPGVLVKTPLVASKSKVTLTLPGDLADLWNDRLASRLKALAKRVGRDPAIVAQ